MNIYIQNIQKSTNTDHFEHFEHLSTEMFNDDLTYHLSRLEVAGVQFVETADGQLRVSVPGDLDDDHRSQLAYLRSRYRDDVERLVRHRSEWIRVWESYEEGGDIVAWADELCRIGEAGGMVCTYPGGWEGLRRLYREYETSAGDDEKLADGASA